MNWRDGNKPTTDSDSAIQKTYDYFFRAVVIFVEHFRPQVA